MARTRTVARGWRGVLAMALSLPWLVGPTACKDEAAASDESTEAEASGGESEAAGESEGDSGESKAHRPTGVRKAGDGEIVLTLFGVEVTARNKPKEWAWNRGKVMLAPGVEMPMIKVPDTRFTMGSDPWEDGHDDDEIKHDVVLTEYWIAETELTQAQWRAVMGTEPFDCSVGCGEDYPANEVSWRDAVQYANALSLRMGLDQCYAEIGGDWYWNDKSCHGFRLPTEAEWEMAARAGTTTAFSFGTVDGLCTHANFNDNSRGGGYGYGYGGSATDCSDGYSDLAKVRTFPANAWGIYEMHGNIREWVWDYYARYDSGTQYDPTGPEYGSSRTLRGGAFVNDPKFLRSAFRDSIHDAATNDNIGFRLVRRVAPGEDLVPSHIGTEEAKAVPDEGGW